MSFQVTNLTERVLEKIHSTLRDKENESSLETKKIVTEHLECLVNIGQCVDHCIKSVLGVSVNLSWVHSLLVCGVNILLQSYTHCKDSSDLYGECLNQFSEDLSMVFKTAHSLQMSQGDEKAFNKLIKVLGFQMKVMVALLRDFSNYLGHCERNILNLLLCFHRLLPPSLCAKQLTEKQTAEIKSHLVNATAPILSYLMSNKILRVELTGTRPTEVPSEDSLPKLLLQIMILDMLPKCEVDIMDRWLTPLNFRENEPTQSILSAIFQSVEMCEVEMRFPVMLPSVMVAGRPLREVSLYEHVATHLCGYIGACRVGHFNTLEWTLLENVLGQSNLLSLLATDCWCFLARYGTAGLCRDQVHYLLKLYLQLKNKTSSDCDRKVLFRLQCLLKRLIKLMARDHQKDLIDIILPEEKPEFWVTVTPDCLHESLSLIVKQRLLTWSVSVIQRSQVKVSEMLVALDFLVDILSNTSKAATKLDIVNPNLILDFIWKMSSYTDNEEYAKTETQEKLVAKLLLLAKCMIQDMPTKLFLQMLLLIQKKVKENISVNFYISVVLFLGQFGKLKIEPNFQSQVHEKFSQVFHHLLCYSHPLVHQVVLSTFVDLVSQTVHNNVITGCIKGEVWLQQRIEDFFNKMPIKISKEIDLAYFLKSEVLERGRVSPSVPNIFQPVVSECNPSASPEVDPPAKRIKLTNMIMGNSGEKPENISKTSSVCEQSLLQRLNSLADDLENECRKSTLTDEFIEEASLIVTRINNCLVPGKTWLDNLT
ncbi:hypothetical protein Btru_074360 [Bulinus truncatus]|nr:hypothetical protein Btru_074360 [Bulinus truncatus]